MFVPQCNKISMQYTLTINFTLRRLTNEYLFANASDLIMRPQMHSKVLPFRLPSTMVLRIMQN